MGGKRRHEPCQESGSPGLPDARVDAVSSLNLMELPLPVLAKIFRLTLDLYRTPYKQQKWWEHSCRSPLSTLPPLCKAAMAVCKAAGFYDIIQINALHTEVDVLRAYQEFVERHLSTVKALEVREPLECDCTSKYKDFRAWFPTLLTSVKAPCLEQVIGVVLPRGEQLDVASLPRSIRSLNFSLAGADPVTDVELLRSLLQLPNLSELRLLVSREVHQALLGPGTSLGSWTRLRELELQAWELGPSDTLESLSLACPNLTHLQESSGRSLPSDIGGLQSLLHVAIDSWSSIKDVEGIQHLGPHQSLTLRVKTLGSTPPLQSHCQWLRLDRIGEDLQSLIWELGRMQKLRGCFITNPFDGNKSFQRSWLEFPWKHLQVLQISCHEGLRLYLPPHLRVLEIIDGVFDVEFSRRNIWADDDELAMDEWDARPSGVESWWDKEDDHTEGLFLPRSLVALCLSCCSETICVPESGVKRRLRLLGTTPGRYKTVGVEAEQVVFDRSEFWKAVACLPEIMLTPAEEEILEEFERPRTFWLDEEENVDTEDKKCYECGDILYY
ncbi:hypothetical protein ACKKBG_A11435 [Auxenochlorella protothecoides x Auxenochlorella symbiontica]